MSQMPLPLIPLGLSLISALPILSKLGKLSWLMKPIFWIARFALKNWRICLTLTIGAVCGYLLQFWIPLTSKTEIQIVEKFITVPQVTEVLPPLNCVKPEYPRIKTNGDLTLAFIKERDARQMCFNSVAEAQKRIDERNRLEQ